MIGMTYPPFRSIRGMSEPQTPQAATLSSTSAGPGDATLTSSTRISPGAYITAAVIVSGTMGVLSLREGKDGVCDYAPAGCLCRQSATHGFLAKPCGSVVTASSGSICDLVCLPQRNEAGCAVSREPRGSLTGRQSEIAGRGCEPGLVAGSSGVTWNTCSL